MGGQQTGNMGLLRKWHRGDALQTLSQQTRHFNWNSNRHF